MTAHPRRRRGTGQIEPQQDGSFRPRLPGKRGARLSPCATYEEAARLLDAALTELAEGSMVSTEGLTLRAFGEGFLGRREKTHADADNDRSTWNSLIMIAPFADWPLSSISTLAVRAHRDVLLARKARPGHRQKRTKARTLSRTRVQNALNLLRVALEDAVERELIEANPAAGVKLPQALGETHDPWTYLVPEEQTALLTCVAIPEDMRLLFAFAIGSGMRESEIWNLHLADLRGVTLRDGAVEIAPDAKIVVRYGGHGKATKGKRIRYVPIFGLVREALELWLPLLEARPNEDRLVWPTERGCRRPDGKAPRHWHEHLIAAGLATAHQVKGATEYRAAHRHDGQVPRFHDLRHSCASSLVAGWWGRRWSLEEVKGLLGHRSITTTERYAHLAESVLQSAAGETDAASLDLPSISPALAAASLASAGNHSAPPARIGRATFGLGNRCSIH